MDDSQEAQQYSAARAITRSIRESLTVNAANQVFVDGVRCAVDADRVSLVTSAAQPGTGAVAISGCPQIDSQLDIVQALDRLAVSFTDKAPSDESMHAFTSQSGAAVALVIPVHSRMSQADNSNNDTSNSYDTSLVLEWMDKSRYLSSAPHISRLTPWIVDAWQARVSGTPTKRSYRWGRWVVFAVLTLALVTYFLTPGELVIVAHGTLEPSEQRLVFAPADGFVDTILVADGQRVSESDLVATINSPSLLLQLDQINAEIGLVQQKRDGLNIAINQINPNDEQASLLGSRLAGEVLELDTRRSSLIAQRNLLETELSRLKLKSPMNGTVIAFEIDRYLENRPVKRGDSLFRIADLTNKWHVDATVVDWESGYVTKAFREATAKKEKLVTQFSLASDPQHKLRGTLTTTGSVMYEGAEGQHLDLRIETDDEVVDPRLGTSVTVFIPCGSYPRWFLWTRSLIDGMHRRFWF